MSSENASGDSAALPPLTVGQWSFLVLLAAVQFMHIVDFMIVMPLSTQLEKDLGVNTQKFGWIVSVYGFGAAAAGLVLAPLLDRFDRKHAMLTLFAGFTLSTLACAVAPNYWTLLVARLLTGAFGGVVASSVLAIVGDAFPPGRRATAMGAVMSAFSVASIAGVPAGLYLAVHSDLGWRAPFAVLGVASVVLLLLACWVMPSVAGHLEHERLSFREVVLRPSHLRAYALMIALVMSTFAMMPYLPAFLEKNVGRTDRDIGMMYLLGGAATLLSMNLVGRLADRFPRLLMFRLLALLALVPIVALPFLPAGSALWQMLTLTTAVMVLTSGRMVPAMAMITSTAEPRYRGSFLSFNAAVQQLALGVAPLIGGFIMGETKPGEPLTNYELVALLCAAAGLASIALAGQLRPASPVETVAFPVEGLCD
jgi:predicted MFS family arabinose efflux permease